MNRRNFLTGAIAATTGGILVAADVLSTKTIFLPPKGGWNANDLTRVPETRYHTISITTPINLNPNDLIDVGGTMYRVTAVNYLPGSIGGPQVMKYALAPANGFFLPVVRNSPSGIYKLT